MSKKGPVSRKRTQKTQTSRKEKEIVLFGSFLPFGPFDPFSPSLLKKTVFFARFLREKRPIFA
jgi:hypothetical protein